MDEKKKWKEKISVKPVTRTEEEAMLVVTRCDCACTDCVQWKFLVGLPTEVRPSMDLLVVQDATFTAKIKFLENVFYYFRERICISLRTH